MTNFNWFVDGPFVLLYILGSVIAGLAVRRYVKKVDDYLVAGRKVDLYLGIASLSATEFGIVTCMANSQLGYKYGFVGIMPGIAVFIAMIFVGWTGFCIRPLRDHQVVTLPELFDQKFGKKVRWASALVIVLGGLLNMGVFLRIGGEFLTVVLGVDIVYLEVIMTILLIIVAFYTVLGGMMSVLITDYMQFIVMSVGVIAFTLMILWQFGWENLVVSLENTYGEQAFNPFAGGQYGFYRIALDALVGLATVLTWQTMVTRVLASEDSRTGQQIYLGTAPFFLVRFLLPALFGIGALYYFTDAGYSPESPILAMPQLMAIIVPAGLFGLIVAGMLAADMSTNSSYLLAWSSVIYNDLLEPVHRNRWPEKKGILVNRILVGLIGLFLLFYGLWYPLKGDLWVYLQVTGSIYLSSMMVLLIAACYWNRANSWGAMAAILMGGLIPITYLILQYLPGTKAFVEAIGPYKSGVATYIFSAFAMFAGSEIKHRILSKKG